MRISIVGAYGYTGRLICAELENVGTPFSIFGRNEKKLEELKEKLKSHLIVNNRTILLQIALKLVLQIFLS